MGKEMLWIHPSRHNALTKVYNIFINRTDLKVNPSAVSIKIKCRGIFPQKYDSLYKKVGDRTSSFKKKFTYWIKFFNFIIKYHLIFLQSEANMSHIMNASPFRSTLHFARKVLLNYPNFFGSQDAADLLWALKSYPKNNCTQFTLHIKYGFF